MTFTTEHKSTCKSRVGFPCDCGALDMPYFEQQPTLRDQFAMAALTGMMSAANSEGEWTHCISSASELAYRAADAMLEARDKQ